MKRSYFYAYNKKDVDEFAAKVKSPIITDNPIYEKYRSLSGFYIVSYLPTLNKTND